MAAAESSKSSSPSLSRRDEFAALDEAIWRDSYTDNLLRPDRPAEARHEDLLFEPFDPANPRTAFERISREPARGLIHSWSPDLPAPELTRGQRIESFVAQHFGILFILAAILAWLLLEAGILPPLDLEHWTDWA